MANGTSRVAQANIVLRGGNPKDELNEEMKLDKGNLPKFPLKAAKSVHNGNNAINHAK